MQMHYADESDDAGFQPPLEIAPTSDIFVSCKWNMTLSAAAAGAPVAIHR